MARDCALRLGGWEGFDVAQVSGCPSPRLHSLPPPLTFPSFSPFLPLPLSFFPPTPSSFLPSSSPFSPPPPSLLPLLSLPLHFLLFCCSLVPLLQVFADCPAFLILHTWPGDRPGQVTPGG